MFLLYRTLTKRFTVLWSEQGTEVVSDRDEGEHCSAGGMEASTGFPSCRRVTTAMMAGLLLGDPSST